MPKKTEINDEILIQLTKDHVPIPVIAEHFNCSESTIKRRKKQLEIYSFTPITEDKLKEEIIKIKTEFTGDNWGTKMVKGNLKYIGIDVGKDKINSILRTVDPIGTEKRKGKTVKRRQYNCPNGNQVILFY